MGLLLLFRFCSSFVLRRSAVKIIRRLATKLIAQRNFSDRDAAHTRTGSVDVQHKQRGTLRYL